MACDRSIEALLGCCNELLQHLGPLPQGAERVSIQIGSEAFVFQPVNNRPESHTCLLRRLPGQATNVECTVVLKSVADFWALAEGRMSPQAALARGRLRLEGSLSTLMALRPYATDLRKEIKKCASLFGVTWLPDSASDACMSCDASFTWLRRKHHCRRCGKLFCNNCAPRRSGPSARQCVSCFEAKSMAAATQDHEKEVLTNHVKQLEMRLEDVESSAAAREAEKYLAGATSAVRLASATALLLLSLSSAVETWLICWVLVGLVFVCRGLFLRQINAAWITVLILWKLKQSQSEAKRLCGVDAERLLKFRYRLVACLGTHGLRELGGVWPKVGQYISTQGEKWPDEVLAELSKLRDAMPAAHPDVTRRTIEEDLQQPLERVFALFDETPIASASIGQVHKAKLHDGRLVAVKVQHRHAARQIPVDVACMRFLARMVRVLSRGEIDLMPVVTEWLGAVIEELDFQNEAKNQIRGRSELLAAGIDVAVPEVYPQFSGRRVLVMEFIEGRQVASGDAMQESERLEVMTQLVHAYAHGLFISGHFNGDPHAGNLLVTHRSGRAQCVLLDWGLTKALSDKRRLAACRLMIAVSMKDTSGIVDAFRDMGMNFSVSKDPEPELLLTILRHISLIESKSESRRIDSKFRGMMDKAIDNGIELHSKVDSYTGDFFFIFRVASLIKGLCAVLDVKADFLSIFVQSSRLALAGPKPQPGVTVFPQETLEAELARVFDAAIAKGTAIGVQIAKVTGDGRQILSMCRGTPSYTSWENLHTSDPFPLGSPCIARALVAAAAELSLRSRGASLAADVSDLWPKFQGPAKTTALALLDGAKPWSKPPPRPSVSLLADLHAMIAWLENEPSSAESRFPPWWPPAVHTAACAALLRGAATQPLSEALRELFAIVGKPLFRANMSPIRISKPLMSVESAEVEAAQDALVASIGAEELRNMHLADVCLTNSTAVRSSECPGGFAATAASLAAVAARTWSRWKQAAEGDDLSCVKRNSRGEVVVVLLTCANAELAQQLATLALT
eukprot:TRINITY_DN105335_c0_g1_i1.p1 TRINITY_DN105335_c0_g1~~TRINITY_DN105335_c0_g1_i1.p1  ORF type:complete len:1024 (+),score=169.26 TRINITY_DN105335_c0_g1_i1:42-3113(+)